MSTDLFGFLHCKGWAKLAAICFTSTCCLHYRAWQMLPDVLFVEVQKLVSQDSDAPSLTVAKRLQLLTKVHIFFVEVTLASSLMHKLGFVDYTAFVNNGLDWMAFYVIPAALTLVNLSVCCLGSVLTKLHKSAATSSEKTRFARLRTAMVVGILLTDVNYGLQWVALHLPKFGAPDSATQFAESALEVSSILRWIVQPVVAVMISIAAAPQRE